MNRPLLSNNAHTKRQRRGSIPHQIRSRFLPPLLQTTRLYFSDLDLIQQHLLKTSHQTPRRLRLFLRAQSQMSVQLQQLQTRPRTTQPRPSRDALFQPSRSPVRQTETSSSPLHPSHLQPVLKPPACRQNKSRLSGMQRSNIRTRQRQRPQLLLPPWRSCLQVQERPISPSRMAKSWIT